MKLLLNLSRVPETGGLRSFATEVLRHLAGEHVDATVVAPRWINANGFQVLRTPSYLSSSAATSRLRPIFWWIYAAWFFPGHSSTPLLGLTHHVVPFRRRQAVTVHDIRPYFLPDSIPQRIYFRYLLPRALRRCDGILTVSEATKQLLHDTYKLPLHKIHVVPNSVELDFSPAGTSAAGPGSPDRAPFLLMVGASWKHKNAEEVLQYANLWKDKYDLAIVCGNPGYREQLKRIAYDNGLADKVQFIPDVDKQQLIWYYQNCSAFLYPSRMEGFGIPPMEAMACGSPVILSDIPVFRELYGDVPLYVSLGDLDSWMRAFENLTDQQLIAQKIHQGIVKAGEFTPARTRVALMRALEAIWGSFE